MGKLLVTLDRTKISSCCVHCTHMSKGPHTVQYVARFANSSTQIAFGNHDVMTLQLNSLGHCAWFIEKNLSWVSSKFKSYFRQAAASPWSHNAFDKAHLFHFLLRPQLELDKMGLGKRLYFQQSLYQEILKKGEKSCGGHLREKTCENGDHAVVSSVGYRIFETRGRDSRVRTTDVKQRNGHRRRSHVLLVEGLLQ